MSKKANKPLTHIQLTFRFIKINMLLQFNDKQVYSYTKYKKYTVKF